MFGVGHIISKWAALDNTCVVKVINGVIIAVNAFPLIGAVTFCARSDAAIKEDVKFSFPSATVDADNLKGVFISTSSLSTTSSPVAPAAVPILVFARRFFAWRKSILVTIMTPYSILGA
jgi:hypothetical protein